MLRRFGSVYVAAPPAGRLYPLIGVCFGVAAYQEAGEWRPITRYTDAGVAGMSYLLRFFSGTWFEVRPTDDDGFRFLGPMVRP